MGSQLPGYMELKPEKLSKSHWQHQNSIAWPAEISNSNLNFFRDKNLFYEDLELWDYWCGPDS